MLTILGNKLAPWFADWYLARTNVKAQQSEQPLDPSRPDYLHEPLDDTEDRGAHGPFDDQAKPRSLQFGARQARAPPRAVICRRHGDPDRRRRRDERHARARGHRRR